MEWPDKNSIKQTALTEKQYKENFAVDFIEPLTAEIVAKNHYKCLTEHPASCECGIKGIDSYANQVANERVEKAITMMKEWLPCECPSLGNACRRCETIRSIRVYLKEPTK